MKTYLYSGKEEDQHSLFLILCIGKNPVHKMRAVCSTFIIISDSEPTATSVPQKYKNHSV